MSWSTIYNIQRYPEKCNNGFFCTAVDLCTLLSTI